MIPCASSSGVCIKTHQLTKSHLELFAGVIQELSVNFLVDRPVVESILLDNLITEFDCLDYILHNNVFRVGKVCNQLRECIRTNAVKSIVQFLIVPSNFVGNLLCGNSKFLFWNLAPAKVT